MENKKKVIIEPISVKLEVELNTTILKALENEGFSLNAVCGGKGTCGQCKIQISSNQMENVSPLSPAERKLLTDKEIEQGYRLGCQTQVKNDVRVYLTESFLLNN